MLPHRYTAALLALTIASCAHLIADAADLSRSAQTLFVGIDLAILALFLVDVSLRYAAYGRPLLADVWFRFDLALTIVRATMILDVVSVRPVALLWSRDVLTVSRTQIMAVQTLGVALALGLSSPDTDTLTGAASTLYRVAAALRAARPFRFISLLEGVSCLSYRFDHCVCCVRACVLCCCHILLVR